MVKRLKAERLSVDEWLNHETTLSTVETREKIVKTLLWLFVSTVFATFSLIFMCGFDYIKLSDSVMTMLAGSTIAEVSGILYIIIKSLFK